MAKHLLAPDNLVVVTAVQEEFRAICRRLTAIRMEMHDGISVMRGDLGCMPASVVCSGMGADRAFRVTEAATSTLEPTLVIGAGYAGGIGRGVAGAHVVVADRVVDAETGSALPAGAAEAGRVDRACRALDYMREHPEHADDAPSFALSREMVHVGAVVSAARTVDTPDRKAALAARVPGALAVDLESVAIAGAARQAGVPWIVIRAVTDGPSDVLPINFDRCSDSAGQPARGRIVAACLARPWTIVALARLGAVSRRAAGNLAAFVEAYARAMGGESH